MSSIITSRLNPFPFHSICIRELGNRSNVRNSQNVVEDFKGSKSKEILKKKIKITSLARLITVLYQSTPAKFNRNIYVLIWICLDRYWHLKFYCSIKSRDLLSVSQIGK